MKGNFHEKEEGVAIYSIRPIGLTKGPRELSLLTYRMNIGVPCEFACYTWFIEGSQPKIMVDAGDMSFAGDTQLAKIETEFDRLHIALDDIKIVILTHLHPDHVSLAHLFKEARFIVQKKELDYAMNPHPFESYLYLKNMFEHLNFEIIEGEKEIIPGVKVFPTPGHSPGGQSVEIQTSAGKAVITGFCCHIKTFEQTEKMKNFFKWEVAIPLVHHDVCQCYESVLKVKKRADLIIANHDPEYLGTSFLP
jgi:N-acyl homoserine lactone hydrolase